MARRTIDQLYALTIPEIQEVFLRQMQGIVDRAILNEMVAAIEAGDVDRLFRASGFTPAALSPILDKIEQVYRNAAEIEVEGWPKRIRTPFGTVQPAFDARNRRVEEDLRKFSSEYITRITAEQRENVRMVLEQGMIRGDNPTKTALDIVGRVNPVTRQREGGVIGLSNQQTQWADNARTYLETLNKEYFNMGLRDKRFDATVRKAIASGKPLPSETVSKLVTAYKSKALKYQADKISRTETMQSINRGQFASIEQGLEEGTFKREQVEKWWDASSDSRTRTSHKELDKRYGKKNAIGMDDAFVTTEGDRLRFPGDQSLGASARAVINCRCRAVYHIDFVGALTDD